MSIALRITLWTVLEEAAARLIVLPIRTVQVSQVEKKSPEHIRIALPAFIEICRRGLKLGKMLDLPGPAVFMLS